MEMFDDKYTVDDIRDLSFKKVPRGIFTSHKSQIALDYHSQLLPLKLGDNVQITLYSKKPEINKNIYLMRGIVYKIEKDGFECSFGGMLLLYKGDINENLMENAEVFVSVAKV